MANSKWETMKLKINKSISDIVKANDDFKPPTLVGELRDRTQTIIRQSGAQRGQIKSFKEIRSDIEAKFPGQSRRYTLKMYHDQIEDLYKERSKSFANVRQYVQTEKDKIINSIVNDLQYRFQYLEEPAKELGQNPIATKQETIEKLRQFSLEELKDIFNEAANRAEQDENGRFTKYSIDELGVKHYTEFYEELQNVITEHLM